jgi:hypothetical protein
MLDEPLPLEGEGRAYLGRTALPPWECQRLQH